jgi:hypothetical protein
LWEHEVTFAFLILEVEIRVLLPKGTDSKQIRVTFSPFHLRVQIGSFAPIIDCDLEFVF